MLKITETNYHGWNALKVETAEAELICPVDIGPRILSCRLKNGENLFHNVGAELGGRGEDEWCLRGGHRLWISPEAKPRTYELDNYAIAHAVSADGQKLTLTGGLDGSTGMRKVIEISAQGPSGFRIVHKITNEGVWPVEAAAWGLSVMEAGGFAAIPLLPKGSHETELLPNYSIVPWTYTDFSLPLWQFHRDFIGIETAERADPQKIGLTDYPAWAAYWQKAGTFVKYSPVDRDANYPDRGSVMEVFSNDFMIELETLGPLRLIAPGETIEHTEDWLLVSGLPKFDNTSTYRNALLPVVTPWLNTLV